MQNPFNIFFPKKMVGVDIGTASVKVVEISRWGQGRTLENYGEIKSDFIYKEPLTDAKMGEGMLASSFVSTAVRGILDEAKIKTRSAIFSIPDFSTFCTSFDMPPMPEKEIKDAIYYNASQYITLPISEVTLDWHVVTNGSAAKNEPIKVFLVAIPNQVISEYQKIAKDAGLELYALEAEAMGITRALIRHTKRTICLMDIGVQSSTINIIDNGFLKRSYTFNFYSNQLTRVISSALGIPEKEAEEIRNKEGLNSSRPEISEALVPLIDPLIGKIRSISAEFSQTEKKEIEEIYLTGGTASLPGLKEYFEKALGKKVYLPNCFSDLLYPPILENTLRQMSPSFAVAVGVALSGLET
jgi:type IV pilus assembly protein PilM